MSSGGSRDFVHRNNKTSVLKKAIILFYIRSAFLRSFRDIKRCVDRENGEVLDYIIYRDDFIYKCM